MTATTTPTAVQTASPAFAFKVGSTVRVENAQTEMLYRGKVTQIEGAKVSVLMKTGDYRGRNFIFDAKREDVTVHEDLICTAW